MVNVKNGVDNIEKYKEILEGKRIGLITNPTGVDKNLKSTIDILNERFNLVALYSPEHGVRGDIQAGVKVDNYIDEKTGIQVWSLYGSSKKISKEMLADIDILIFDIQDVGARFYTYLYTLTYAMEACNEFDKKIIVLDRINPIGRNIEGNILNGEYSSFVGKYPLPTRYGLTIGEFANYINIEYKINCDLSIVKVEGWSGEYYDETDLVWIPPSPNMPTIDTAIAYIGTTVFEGTNVSEGRGTTKPFEVIGAPWMNNIDVISKMKSYNLEGVKVRPIYFTPTFSKYKDELCKGIAIHIVDRKKFKAFNFGIRLLKVIKEIHKEEFEYIKPFTEGGKPFIDLIFGGDELREEKLTAEEIINKAIKEDEIFIKNIEKYYMY